MAILWTAFGIFLGVGFTVTGYFSPQRAIARISFGLAALTLSSIIIAATVGTGHPVAWEICFAVLGCLATGGLFFASWKWTAKVIGPQFSSPAAQAEPPRVGFRLQSTLETNNLKPIRFAVREHGGYTTHYGKASSVTVYVSRSDACPLHLIDCRLVNARIGEAKTVPLNVLSSERTDVTMPLLELVHGSTNPGSVDWCPDPASYQVSVTVRYVFGKVSQEIGPVIYDISTKPLGSLAMGITVSQHPS